MEQFDKLLECSICLGQLKCPKVLGCQHSFCFEPCLKGLSKASWAKTIQIECPLCRQKFDFNSVHEIPNDIKSNNLLEIRKNNSRPVQSTAHALNVNTNGQHGDTFYLLFSYTLIYIDFPTDKSPLCSNSLCTLTQIDSKSAFQKKFQVCRVITSPQWHFSEAL